MPPFSYYNINNNSLAPSFGPSWNRKDVKRKAEYRNPNQKWLDQHDKIDYNPSSISIKDRDAFVSAFNEYKNAIEASLDSEEHPGLEYKPGEGRLTNLGKSIANTVGSWFGLDPYFRLDTTINLNRAKNKLQDQLLRNPQLGQYIMSETQAQQSPAAAYRMIDDFAKNAQPSSIEYIEAPAWLIGSAVTGGNVAAARGAAKRGWNLGVKPLLRKLPAGTRHAAANTLRAGGRATNLGRKTLITGSKLAFPFAVGYEVANAATEMPPEVQEAANGVEGSTQELQAQEKHKQELSQPKQSQLQTQQQQPATQPKDQSWYDTFSQWLNKNPGVAYAVPAILGGGLGGAFFKNPFMQILGTLGGAGLGGLAAYAIRNPDFMNKVRDAWNNTWNNKK